MKRIVVSLLSCTLVLSVWLSFGVFAQESWEKEYDDQKAELTQQIEGINNNLSKIGESVQDVLNRKATLSEETANIRSQISELDSLIEETKSAIVKVGLEIDREEEEVAVLQDQVVNVFRQLQKTQSRSFVEVLLSSSTIGEALSKANALTKVEKELESIKKELEAKIEELEKSKELLKNTENTQRQALAYNKSRKSELEKLLEETKGEEARYQQLITNLEGQKNSFAADISNIDSKKAAEAKQRAEAAEAARIAAQKQAEQEAADAKARQLALEQQQQASNSDQGSGSTPVVSNPTSSSSVSSSSSGGGYTSSTTYNSAYNPSNGVDQGGGDYNNGGCVQETVNYSGIPQDYLIEPTYGYITNGFGCVPWSVGNFKHDGVDIANGLGTNVVASADGVVYFSGYKAGFGNIAIIEHEPSEGVKIYSTYAHLNTNPVVSNGEFVSQGQLIGFLGNTGYSTGVHLHYSLADDSIEYTGNPNCNPTYTSYTLCFNPFTGPFDLFD